MADKKRNDFSKINILLDMFPAVVIIGPRQAGKTTLAKQLKPDWNYIDLEKPSDFDRLSYDPEFYFEQHPENVIIDEAQRMPVVFEILRGVIDNDRKKAGRFIITGSSSPDILNNVSESLAGRVAIVELGTFKANELFSKPLSHFYDLFKKKLTKRFFEIELKSNLSLKQIQTTWFRGGYPEPALNSNPDFYLQWMENYENTYINRDIANLFPKLNKIAYRRFLNMLCRLSGTIVNKSDIAASLEVSEGSVRQFVEIAGATFLWRNIPSFDKSICKSTIKMPKGYICDSGLLHTLLGITDEEALYHHPIVGHSFESFIVEEIIKGLKSTMITHWKPYYYRTRAGAEVDLILQGSFGVLPIEIKYGSKTDIKQLMQLEKFVKENDLPFGLLINQAKEAMWLSKTIFQLPANYL